MTQTIYSRSLSKHQLRAFVKPFTANNEYELSFYQSGIDVETAVITRSRVKHVSCINTVFPTALDKPCHKPIVFVVVPSVNHKHIRCNGIGFFQWILLFKQTWNASLCKDLIQNRYFQFIRFLSVSRIYKFFRIILIS